MFEFKEDDYVLGIWRVGFDSGDVMITAVRRATRVWDVQLRIRIYRDDKAFDSADEKITLARDFPIDAPEADVYAACEKAYTHYLAGAQENEEVNIHGSKAEVRGTSEDAMRWMLAQPWCHAKVISKEEYERQTE